MYNQIIHQQKQYHRTLRHRFEIATKSPIILNNFGVLWQSFRVNYKEIGFLELLSGHNVRFWHISWNNKNIMDVYLKKYVKKYLKIKGFKLCQ